MFQFWIHFGDRSSHIIAHKSIAKEFVFVDYTTQHNPHLLLCVCVVDKDRDLATIVWSQQTCFCCHRQKDWGQYSLKWPLQRCQCVLRKKDGRHCVVMLWFNSFSSILVLLDDWHPRPIQTQYSIHNSWKMSEYLFFCAFQSGYFTCSTYSFF